MADEEPTDEQVLDAVEEGRDFFLRVIGVRGPEDPWFKAVEIEVPKGKLVALDAAVMAAHLFVAIVMFKNLSALFQEKIRAMEKGVGELAVKTVAGFIFKKIVAVLRFISIVGELWKEEDTGRALEKKIRAASATVRKQLIAEALSQTTKRRCRRTVHSRHRSPRQRKANASWQTKRPRTR